MKKKRKTRLHDLLLPAAVPIALLMGIVGYLWEIPTAARTASDVGDALYYTLRLFLFLPAPITPGNLWWHVARWLAPMTVLWALFYVFELQLRTFFLRTRARFFGKNHIVLGYNDNSRHYSANLCMAGKRTVVICKENVSREERLEMARKGILLWRCRTFDAPTDWLREDFAYLHVAQSESVTFLYENDFDNLSAFLTFCDCLLQKAPQTGEKPHRIHCRIRCRDVHVRALICDYYEAICRKDKKWRKRIRLDLFDEDVLAVRSVLRQLPLHTANYQKMPTERLPDDGETWNVSLAVVGCNTVGVQFILQAVNVGVIGNGGCIRIDVYDADAQAESRLYASYPELWRAAEIEFHCVDVRTAEFDEALRQKQFTYIAICFHDPVVAIGAMQKMHTRFSDVPTVISAGNGFSLLSDACGMENTTVLPEAGKLLRDRTIDAADLIAVCSNHWYGLFAEGEEEALRASEKMGAAVAVENGAAREEWNGLSEYDRASSRAQAAHSICKRAYIRRFYECYLFDGTLRESRTVYASAEVRRYLERAEAELIRIRTTGQTQDLMAFLRRNPMLAQLAELEHSRWCHYMYSEGWTHGSLPGKPRSKDTEHKRHPCLVSWQQICEEFPETVFYDLISVTVLRYLPEVDI